MPAVWRRHRAARRCGTGCATPWPSRDDPALTWRRSSWRAPEGCVSDVVGSCATIRPRAAGLTTLDATIVRTSTEEVEGSRSIPYRREREAFGTWRAVSRLPRSGS
jgi:hypothetical protein